MNNLNFEKERIEFTPVIYFINYINLIHDNHLKEKFKNITPRDFTYLSNIFYHRNISQKELAEMLFVSESNVTQIINRLEKNGYVIRENDYKNNRGNFISRQQIKYILTNKRYNGTYIYADPSKSRKRKFDNGVRKPDYYEKKNAFPKIIDDDLFERVQEIIMSNNSSHHLSSARTIYLLSDLCVCGCCHNKLTGWSRPKYKGKIYYDYVCKTHKNNSTKCPTKRINKMYVENIILDIVIIIINKIMPKLKNEFNDYLKIKLEKYLNKRNIKENELNEKNKKLDKLIERLTKDNTKSVIYEKRINELEEEIVKLSNIDYKLKSGLINRDTVLISYIMDLC